MNPIDVKQHLSNIIVRVVWSEAVREMVILPYCALVRADVCSLPVS